MRVVETDAARPASLAFSKMNGLGNDFVILDARPNGLSLPPDTVRQLAARDNPITQGCDQLLIIQPPRDVRYYARFAASSWALPSWASPKH